MTIKEKMKLSIAEIEEMEVEQLRDKFHSLYGNIPHPINTRTLKNRIIYQIQKMYLGGLSQADEKLLTQLASQQKYSLPIYLETKSSLSPAIHYLREWKGKIYDVTAVSEKCFMCEGQKYKSLSAVARSITGTRWNGKIFFGVKENEK